METLANFGMVSGKTSLKVGMEKRAPGEANKTGPRSKKIDVFLESRCNTLDSIWDGDEGEAEEKTKATSKLSQQGGEGVEQHLKKDEVECNSF